MEGDTSITTVGDLMDKLSKFKKTNRVALLCGVYQGLGGGELNVIDDNEECHTLMEYMETM